MSQTLKVEVNKKIKEAALKVFSKTGYKNSRIQDIAQQAGISTGNIYRYYKDKNDLFYTLITPDILSQTKQAIKERFESYSGMLPPYTGDGRKKAEITSLGTMYTLRYEFCILVDGAGGSVYESFKDELVDYFIENVRMYIKSVEQSDPRYGIEEGVVTKTGLLKIIYSNVLRGLITILTEDMPEEIIKHNVEAFIHYHLYGIFNFLVY